MDEDPNSQDAPHREGTSSVRVIIVVCLGSMVVLGAMAIYWLTIRL